MRTITDNIHGNIKVSDLEMSIINTKIFNRLHNIYQSSTVYLTFPSTRTKRYEHSIGVMHLAGNLFYRTVCNTDYSVFNTFMEKTKRILSSYDEIRLDFFTKDTFFNSFMPLQVMNDESNKCTYLFVFESLRIASLLHDIGHPPFSHIIEDALQNFFDETINGESNESKITPIAKSVKSWVKKLKWSSPLKEKKEKLHELIGRKLIDVVGKNLENTYKEDKKLINLLFDFAKKILMGKDFKMSIKEDKTIELDSKEFDESVIFTLLHSILSSEVDVDRLDYILRDSINSGAGLSLKSYDRLFDNTKLMIKEENNNQNGIVIAFSIKIKDMLDEILRERYYIYNYINYHHNAVKNATLLEEIVKNTLYSEYCDNEDEIHNKKHLPIDIEGFWVILNTILSPKKTSNIGIVEEYLLQWDDNWLIVMLKSYRYQREKRSLSNEKNLSMIDELIAGVNSYSTLLKREDETKEFYEKLFSKISEKIQGFDETKVFKDKIGDFCINVNSFIDFPEKYSIYMTKILNYDQNIYDIERETNSKLKVKYLDLEVQIVPINRMKFIGGQDTLYMYDGSNSVNDFRKYSGIYESLIKVSKFLSPMYILYRCKSQNKDNGEMKKDIVDYSIETLAQYFAERLSTLSKSVINLP